MTEVDDDFYEPNHEVEPAVEEMAEILHLDALDAEIPEWHGDSKWEASVEPGMLGAEEESNLLKKETNASALLKTEYEFWKNDERRKTV